MKKIDYAHLMGVDKYMVVYNKYKTEIDAITDVPGLMTQLTGKRADITDAINWAQIETSGTTKDAKIKQLDMAGLVIKFAHKGVAKARMINNQELVTLMDFEITDITHRTKEGSIDICREIVKGFTDNPTIFTNILPADITAMNAAIDAFDAAKTDTPIAIDDRKIEGTQELQKLLKESYGIMQIVYDFVYGEYIDTNKTIVKELGDSMVIEIEGVRHTGITVTCSGPIPEEKIENGLIQGIQLKIVELDRTAISDINGVISLIKFKPGTYHVEFTKEHYRTKRTVIYFKRGRTVEMEVEMEME